MVCAPSVPPISHPLCAESLPIRFFPVGLITEDLTLFPMEQRIHLRDVGGRSMRGDQTVHHTATVGSHVHFHTEVPGVALLCLTHLRVSAIRPVLGRTGRCDHG